MMKSTQKAQQETDDRFPSGPWKGFWVQEGHRGWMNLQLSFKAGRVEGEGKDLVGEFIIAGSYSTTDGHVSLRKGYVGQHTVDYAGWAEIQHGIWGLWNIHSREKGGWQIWPEGREVGNAIEAREAIPASERQPVRQ